MGSSVKISFGVFDVTAREDSTPACADRQPFAALADLKAEEPVCPLKAATLEEDFFLLDGSFSPFPDAPAGLPWGLWSASMSDEKGGFAVPPVLDVTFTQPHSSMGLTLTFAPETGDYASQVEAEWYDGAGNLLRQRLFAVDKPRCYLAQKVEEYHRVVLRFLSTAKPHRYLKLQNVEYGLEKVLGRKDIEKAKILEEMDPTSAELAINTLDFTVHSKEADFSLLNPQGIFSVLQQRQKLTVVEQVNGEDIPMGTYYLERWENGSENGADLSAVDLVGVMDQTIFAGGMYENIPMAALVEKIAASADVPYSLDERLMDVPLSGYLPLCTHREALQQAAFAAGAVVDCSRGDVVKIIPPPDRPSSYIRKGRKFSGGRVKLRPLVTGVEVLAHKYVPNTEPVELFSDTLQPGEYQIAFDQPVHTLSITGGEILNATVNGAAISVSMAGDVTLSGQGYTDVRQVVAHRMATLPANTTPNILRVEDATLVSGGNAKAVAARLYDYHQQRYETEFDLLTAGETVGDRVLVDSLRGEKLKGVVESMEIDLAGGFIASVRVAGVRIPTISGYYAGELRTGEEMGVL